MPADIRETIQKTESYTREVLLAIEETLLQQNCMTNVVSYDHTIAFLESQGLDWIIANLNGGDTPYAQVGYGKDCYAATPLLSLWLAYFRFKLGDERITELDNLGR